MGVNGDWLYQLGLLAGGLWADNYRSRGERKAWMNDDDRAMSKALGQRGEAADPLSRLYQSPLDRTRFPRF